MHPNRSKSGPLLILYIVALALVYFALTFFVLHPQWRHLKVGLCTSSCQLLYDGSAGQVEVKRSVGTRTGSDESRCACQTVESELKAGYFLVRNSFFDWLLVNALGIILSGASLFFFILLLVKSTGRFFPGSNRLS